MSLPQWIVLLLAGVSATGGQICITTAYTKAPAKEISVFDYSQIIFAAILGLVHDTVFVVGVFSILGIFYGVQIDSLFVTALLTVIGFSVHDTIVVFDRVRENLKYYSKKMTFGEIMNVSINQTLTRSINTSLTTLITLAALYFFGGVTTKDFVLAMILGIAIGTYSSIFFCSSLIELWEDKKK